MNRYLTSVRDTLIVLLATLPIILSAGTNLNEETLACTNQINVSVNGTCGVELSADQLLEPGYVPGNYEFQVEIRTGLYADLTDVSRYLNKKLKYTITNTATGLYCWGHIVFEDKSAPQVICDSCTDPLVTDPDCILNCAEYPLFKHFDPQTGQRGYDAQLLDKIIPSDAADFIRDNVTDNCDQAATVHYIDRFINGNCDKDISLIRTWIVEYDLPNGKKGSVECNRYYKFEALEIFDAGGTPIITEGDGTPVEDEIFLPNQFVVVPSCSSGYNPADIAAYFDNPLTIDYDSDDNGNDPDEGDVDSVIENNEGIWQAYPHYYIAGVRGNDLHAQPIDTEICRINATYTDVVLDACSPDCGGNVKVSRVWNIFDWCSSDYFEYQQIIEVVDRVPPVMDVNDLEASVDTWHCYATYQVPAPEHLYDECEGEVTYKVELKGAVNEITGNHTDGYVIHQLDRGLYTLIYTGRDCCGNVNIKEVRLQVDDNTPPVPVVKENIVLDMAPTGIVGEPDRAVGKIYASAIDNGSYDGCSDIEMHVRRAFSCAAEDTIWSEFVHFCCADLDGVASKEIQVEFRVRDWNGNANYLWSTILLEDKGATTTCPSDRVLTCDQDIWDFNVTGYPESQSSCEYLELEIDTAATFDKTIAKKKRATEGRVPGYIGVEVEAYDPACGFGAMRREWITTSGTLCYQWFVIEPGIQVFDPNTIQFPDDVVVVCSDFDSGVPTWVDASCMLVGHILDSDTIRVEAGGACMKIINRWSVINWCSYVASDSDLNEVYDLTDDGITPGSYRHTQIVEIHDETYPEVICEAEKVIEVNQDCEGKGFTLTASASDVGDCASPWLSWEARVDLGNDWDFEYIYSSEVNLLLNNEPNPYYIAKTISGQEVSITLPDVFSADKNARHRVDWVVDDGCGNETICAAYFTIQDKKAPTPYCLNLGTTVMENGEVELWAIDFNVGSFDNCSSEAELMYTFTNVPPPPRCDEEFDSQTDLLWYDGSYWFYNSSEGSVDDDRDCPIDGEGAYSDGGYNPVTNAFESYGGDIHRWEPALQSSGKVFTTADVDDEDHLELPVYVWDECRNIDFCVVRLRIVDNGGGAGSRGVVGGLVRTENNEVIEEVMTELMTDLPNYPKYKMTDNTGSYAFEDIVLNYDYQVNATRNDNPLNGVSTIDLVKIQRHILGIEKLDSPYKMIAADINNDQRINGQDLVELRKLILGIYQSFPQSESWKIFSAKSEMTMENPWFYAEDIMVLNIEQDMMDQDFIGVKVGDVDNSAIANSLVTERRQSGSANLIFEDRLVQEGEIVDVSFSSTVPTEGYQLAFEINGLALTQVRGEGLAEGNYSLDGSTLALSCNAAAGLQEQLFTLSFTSEKTGIISELLQLNNSILRPEIYQKETLEILDLELNRSQNGFIELGQNEPNPFKDRTTIDFNLQQDARVTMSFYDVTGRTLKTLELDGTAGLNTIELTNDGLGTGVIYYKVATAHFIAVKNMLIIE